MEVQGKLIGFLPEQSGESARGAWIRGGFVIETFGDYPKKIALQCFGQDKVNEYKSFPIGSIVKVYFSLESREYPSAGSNKWFTNASCIKIMPSQPQGYAQQPTFQQPIQQAQFVGQQPMNNAPQPTYVQQPQVAPQQVPVQQNDDLPF